MGKEGYGEGEIWNEGGSERVIGLGKKENRRGSGLGWTCPVEG